MSNFKAHFLELKLKVYYSLFSFLITFSTSYFFAPNLINILSYHLLLFVKSEDSDFIFNNLFEVFSTYCILAFYSCCFFTTPLILYFISTFIKSGLFEYEKKILFSLYKFFLCSITFSSLFTYYIIFPILLSFLLNLDLITNTSFVCIKMEMKIYEYTTFLSRSLLLYCFVIFQLPVVFFTFVFFKQPTIKNMVNKRKLWIVLSLIFGCLFSSPDLASFFAISFSFIFFFETLIFFLILKHNYKLNFNLRESCLNGKRQVC